MSRIRSLTIRSEVDVAQRAHNCKGNAQHRIKKGDKRLKVRKGRICDHYCLKCAKVMIQKSIAKLKDLDQELNSDMQESSEKSQAASTADSHIENSIAAGRALEVEAVDLKAT